MNIEWFVRCNLFLYLFAVVGNEHNMIILDTRRIFISYKIAQFPNILLTLNGLDTQF